MMKKKRLLRLGPPAAIAVGAGIAAAVLFSLAGQATFLAWILASLSPLPIMIAMLGFGGFVGAGATVAATLVVSAIAYAHQRSVNLDEAALHGLVFICDLGLPAFWLSFLVVLSRTKGSTEWVVTTRVGSFFARQYCPLERILSYAVSICATIGVAIAIYVSSLYSGFDIALERLVGEVTPFVEGLIGPNTHLPKGVDAHGLAQFMVLAAAPAVAGSSLLMLIFNLWLAGRVVQLSGLLPRPWPDISRELAMPRIYLLVFGVAALASPYLGGLPGLIIGIVAVTVGIAFALVGLAVAHYLSRGLSVRILLLIAIYLGLAVPVTWLVFVFGLIALGVLEAAFSLRDRKDKAASSKT
jgi:hypothetical protein